MLSTHEKEGGMSVIGIISFYLSHSIMFRCVSVFRGLTTVSSMPFSRSFAKVVNTSGTSSEKRTLKGATSAVTLVQFSDAVVMDRPMQLWNAFANFSPRSPKALVSFLRQLRVK